MEPKISSVICLKDSAFYSLIDTVVEYIKEKHPEAREVLYLDKEETLKFLNIGNTKLQELRDTGKIRFTQPSRNKIMYERVSLIEYLQQHTKNTF